MTGQLPLSDKFIQWQKEEKRRAAALLSRRNIKPGAKVRLQIGGSFFGPVYATGTLKVSKHGQLFISVPARQNTITGKARRMCPYGNPWTEVAA